MIIHLENQGNFLKNDWKLGSLCKMASKKTIPADWYPFYSQNDCLEGKIKDLFHRTKKKAKTQNTWKQTLQEMCSIS
jgi:hypothetical protein